VSILGVQREPTQLDGEFWWLQVSLQALKIPVLDSTPPGWVPRLHGEHPELRIKPPDLRIKPPELQTKPPELKAKPTQL
jgi:hypothetical protein